MRLIPSGMAELSGWDEFWEEGPGLPQWDGVWRRYANRDTALPEFEFEEGHERNRNDPPHRFLIGSHEHAHIFLKEARIPRRHLLIFKHGRRWFLERIDPSEAVYCNGQALVVGKWHELQDGDEFSLLKPPTPFSYLFKCDEASNWYLDLDREANWRRNIAGVWYQVEGPSLYPSRVNSPATAHPSPPEDLKRLAWQTDQMRNRSEEGEVRVSDWAAFATHAREHYRRRGFVARPFKGSACEPEAPAAPRPFRALPDWIADVVAGERQVPGVHEPLAFEEALRLAGRQPLELPGESTGAGSLAEGPRSAVGRGLQRDLRSWLWSLDESGALLGYETTILEKYGDLNTLFEKMVSASGILDEKFFEVASVEKLGHKRIFEKFFKERADFLPS